MQKIENIHEASHDGKPAVMRGPFLSSPEPAKIQDEFKAYEVRLNEISNYKQMLVGVYCIYAVIAS